MNSSNLGIYFDNCLISCVVFVDCLVDLFVSLPGTATGHIVLQFAFATGHCHHTAPPHPGAAFRARACP